MKENTLEISKGACMLNNAPLKKVTRLSMTESEKNLGIIEVTLSFELPRENFKYNIQKSTPTEVFRKFVDEDEISLCFP